MIVLKNCDGKFAAGREEPGADDEPVAGDALARRAPQVAPGGLRRHRVAARAVEQHLDARHRALQQVAR